MEEWESGRMGEWERGEGGGGQLYLLACRGPPATRLAGFNVPHRKAGVALFGAAPWSAAAGVGAVWHGGSRPYLHLLRLTPQGSANDDSSTLASTQGSDVPNRSETGAALLDFLRGSENEDNTFSSTQGGEVSKQSEWVAYPLDSAVAQKAKRVRFPLPRAARTRNDLNVAQLCWTPQGHRKQRRFYVVSNTQENVSSAQGGEVARNDEKAGER